METTSKYIDRKEYVKSGEKPQAKTQTNPRYRNFTQLHFTAGDEEQFQNMSLSKKPGNSDNRF